MPINKDSQQGGSKSNGSKSTKYCSLCYKDGTFLDGCNTAKEMLGFCIQKMNESGTPTEIAWLFTRDIPIVKWWSV